MARKNEYVVVGFKRVDYKKKDGGEVHGCEVYLEPTQIWQGVSPAIFLFDGVFL